MEYEPTEGYSMNKQILIDTLPEGKLSTSNYRVETSEMPAPGDGEVLCRTLAITIGAGRRAGLQGSASYAGAPTTGIVMGATGVSRVIESRAEGISSGDVVVCPSGWQEYSVHESSAVQVVEDDIDLVHYLGALGINGLTAYLGLLEVGRPRPGETVLVSAAAGSVGHLVGQIAAVKGCRTVGIAGSEEKCRLLTEELGFDAAVSYRDPDFRKSLKTACPNGVDVYFDNTGGDILGYALFRMNNHGCIVCCGVVSQYDTSDPAPGPKGVPGLLVNKRIRMEGFLIFDFAEHFAQAKSQIRQWIENGDLVPRNDIYEGLENAPAAFVDLLAGGNVGTRIVRIADD